MGDLKTHAHALAYTVARLLRWLSFLLFTTAGAIALGLAIYDLREFHPRRAEIDAMLAAAKPLERSPPRMLIQLQLADAREAVASRTSRLILFELDRGVGQRPTLEWKSRSLLWVWLVDLHLSEQEQLLIMRTFAFSGYRRYGFEDGALEFFGRPLDRLSELELAELVVLARWPSRYRTSERAEFRARAAAELLERVRSATQPAR